MHAAAIYQHRWRLIKFGFWGISQKDAGFVLLCEFIPESFVWTQMDVAASVYPKRAWMNHKYGQQSDRLTRGPVMAWRGFCAVEIVEIFNTRPEAWLFKGHYTWLWNKPAAPVYSEDFSPPSMLFRKTWHLDKKAVHIISYMSCFYLYQHHNYIRLYSGGYILEL